MAILIGVVAVTLVVMLFSLGALGPSVPVDQPTALPTATGPSSSLPSASAAASTSAPASPSGSAVASPTPLPSPTLAPSPVVAQEWTVVLHGIARAEANVQFPSAEAGNAYWILDITVTNDAAVAQTAGWGWRIQDDGGFTHEAEIFPIKSPRLQGDVAPDGTVRGYLAFQVADGHVPVAVLFQGGTLGSGPVTVIRLPQIPAASGLGTGPDLPV